MTSEGTGTLILVLTFKRGQSVAHNKHRIFLFVFSVSERIYIVLKAFYRLNFRLQTYSVLTCNRT